MRQHHVPRLRIRKALEEDNDDVIPILETQNDDLRKLYGDFYIAEMISNPDNDRQMVVAEHMYRAIGFMSMNTNIDFQMLNYHFEMAPFYGLRKPNENDDVCSPSMVPGDSVEGLLLPSVIQSGEELTRLSVLSSVLEQDLITQTISAILPVDLNRTSSEEDSMESILIDESMTLFPSDEDFSAIGSILEEEEEDIIEGKQITIERNEPYFKLRSLDFPTYCGEPNAFMIELFAMHQDWDEKMSPDFLEAAFECYPDLDYCIMTLPPTCNTFPLLEHFVVSLLLFNNFNCSILYSFYH
ncbi:hypothetical protein C0J52_20280 [Blattella germanica]|nr:hypothetical protein C0J52_20280 [Blattella germanica]